MKFLYLTLALTLGAVPAFAGKHVKGWHNCRFYDGSCGNHWHSPCHHEATYETNDCNAAYDQLKRDDCCAPKGGIIYQTFRISCENR